MKYIGIAKDWITGRIGERTSWDGGVLIAIGVIALLAKPLIGIAAWIAIAYGAWTIWKKEDK